MKLAIAILLTASLLVFSCKKKNPQVCTTTYSESTDNDTVFPSSYLMAYPGSVWNYDNGSTRTCTGWEQVGIVQNTRINGCTTVHTTHTIVAHASFGYIAGFNELTFLSGDQSTLLQPLLAPVTGNLYYRKALFGSGEDAGYTEDTRTVVELLDSMTVLGVLYHDVVHTHKDYFTYFYHVSGGVPETADCYYANNVGMIRGEYTYGNSVPTILNLVSYVIGPH